MKSKSASHVYSIDVLRFLGSFLIVLLHAGVFYTRPTDNHGILQMISFLIFDANRMAVPLYFIFSGYFFSKMIQKGTLVKSIYLKTCGRLLFICFCFNFFYSLVPWEYSYYAQNIFKYGFWHAYYWHLLEDILTTPVFVWLCLKIPVNCG